MSWRNVRVAVSVLGVLALAACPSSRGSVDDAMEVAFRCDPAGAQEGQCPEGAVCGLEGTCHARVSGAWACDPAANRDDGTNAFCFGVPADVCGADGRCHAASDAAQGWACSSDSQCLNGRRCSEASWTCVETSSEALLASPTPPVGEVELLPSLLEGRGREQVIAASAVTGSCTGSLRNGELQLRDVLHECLPGSLRNRVQAFARVDAGRVQTSIVGQGPLGGDPRHWLGATGVHAFHPEVLTSPVAEGMLAVEMVYGAQPIFDPGMSSGGVFPLVAWVNRDGDLLGRAHPTFAAPQDWRVAGAGWTPPAGADLKLFKSSLSGTRNAADLLIRSATEIRHVEWQGLDTAVSPVPRVLAATPETGDLDAVTLLPDGSGVMVVARNGFFVRSFITGGPESGWREAHAFAQVWDLDSEEQGRFDALMAGPREVKLHASADATQVAMTVRSTGPSDAPVFKVLPAMMTPGCRLGGVFAPEPGFCFRVACEPCATQEGEQVLSAAWVPREAGAAARFVVRCGSASGTRAVEVSAPWDTEQSAARCRVDALTDGLGRESDGRDAVDNASAVALRDAHNVIAVMPRADGTAELLASGLDRRPHGLVRLNGRLAAFTANRTWQRTLTADGIPSGGFVHSPMDDMSILGSVHVPRTFTRTLLLAQVHGQPQVVDVTRPSSDMFPTAAVFRTPPVATGAQHHAVVVASSDGSGIASRPLVHTLFATVGDSLLGANVSSMVSASPQGAMAELSVRMTPQPGSDLRSVAFTEPLSDQGAPLFARGFALTENGLFGFEAVSPNRFRSYELASRDERWVGLYTKGAPLSAAPARARLAYRDGVIVSLPSQVPLSNPLTTPSTNAARDHLVAVLHHCGHTYGLSARTLFHLTVTPGQPVGEWVDVLRSADAESLPFTDGALLRDGDTLYLFGRDGHARTWTAPACDVVSEEG